MLCRLHYSDSSSDCQKAAQAGCYCPYKEYGAQKAHDRELDLNLSLEHEIRMGAISASKGFVFISLRAMVCLH